MAVAKCTFSAPASLAPFFGQKLLLAKKGHVRQGLLAFFLWAPPKGILAFGQKGAEKRPKTPTFLGFLFLGHFWPKNGL